MAGTLNQLLGVDHWAKVFADFWGVPNLSRLFAKGGNGKAQAILAYFRELNGVEGNILTRAQKICQKSQPVLLERQK